MRDTLPPTLKDAIAAHEVLVGMNHRMVLAALGAPESKIREQPSGDPNGGRYEEWIYGHVPQTIRFVRFVGDRVTMVEIAALGKPIEIHDKDEMGGYNQRRHPRGCDGRSASRGGTKEARATRRCVKPGEAAPPGGPRKVQFPTGASRCSIPPRSALRIDSSWRPPHSSISARCRVDSVEEPQSQFFSSDSRRGLSRTIFTRSSG